MIKRRLIIIYVKHQRINDRTETVKCHNIEILIWQMSARGAHHGSHGDDNGRDEIDTEVHTLSAIQISPQKKVRIGNR